MDEGYSKWIISYGVIPVAGNGEELNVMGPNKYSFNISSWSYVVVGCTLFLHEQMTDKRIKRIDSFFIFFIFELI